jgi:hypothetical protein
MIKIALMLKWISPPALSISFKKILAGAQVCANSTDYLALKGGN